LPEPRPTTGPVRLPANPGAVAQSKVSGLAGLGVTHKPPTPREFEHAALDVALAGGSDEEVYAVLAHLDASSLDRLHVAAQFLVSAADLSLRDRGRPLGE
jgi:hypothetical protein